jgi:pimeloyl-ACP methyl ester carboxylesterase
MTRVFVIFSTLGLAWLGANLFHGLWVGVRRFFWEKRFVREPSGLLPDAAAYWIGSGPVALLFVHGFADTPCLWWRITRRLAAAKHPLTCRAMRLPGSAEPAAWARRQSLQLWRSQVADELGRLRETHATVWIVGHSLGGALALDAALRLPGLVDGVAVFAPLIEVSRKRSPLLPPRVWFGLARAVFGLSPTFESPFSSVGVAGDDPAFTYVRDRFIPFGVYRALFRLIRANREQASRLACPLFAVVAGRDSVVDSAAARRWLAACPGPKEIRDLPDAKHVLPLAAGWEALADDLTAFIRQHTVPSRESAEFFITAKAQRPQRKIR